MPIQSKSSIRNALDKDLSGIFSLDDSWFDIYKFFSRRARKISKLKGGPFNTAYNRIRASARGYFCAAEKIPISQRRFAFSSEKPSFSEEDSFEIPRGNDKIRSKRWYKRHHKDRYQHY